VQALPTWGEGGRRRTRRGVSRRSFLQAGVALGAAGGLARLSARHARLIDTALSSDQASTGSLSDIEHVVVLMQENRSFDHYFGTMSGVRGYGDPQVPRQVVDGVRTPVFDQYGPPGYSVGGEPYLQPFELIDSFPSHPGETTNDITHDWGPTHYGWNNGAMDQVLKAHLASDGSSIGFLTMGYYTRDDLPFYHSLADAFTICDGYHCSVLGPTYPNRLMQMTGSLGADGTQGGTVLETYSDPVQYYGTLEWLTYPEALTEGGVSWKVYQDPTTTVLYNVLPFFKSFSRPSTSTDAQNAANGLAPQYPAEFEADVAAGTLPQVSWILPPAACCEHPAAPPEYGEWLVSQILSTLVSNPDVWAKTIFLVIYDEHGGWFDHVPPVTPGPMVLSPRDIPAGDEYHGEYVTGALPSAGTYSINGEMLNIYGPLGLGFRTPALVLSPFSRGGYVCSETLDHISVLKLIEQRFGVPVPNVSSWRYDTVGNIVDALALSLPADASVPSLPSASLTDPSTAAAAVVDAFLGTEDYAPIPYPAPTSNDGIPAQESSPTRIRLPLAAGAATTGASASQGGGARGNGPGVDGVSGSGRSYGEGGPRALFGQAAGGGGASGAAAAGAGARPATRAGHPARRAVAAPAHGSATSGGDSGLIAGTVAGAAAALAAAGVAIRRLRPRSTSPEGAAGPPPPA